MHDSTSCQRWPLGIALAAFVILPACSKKPEANLFPAGSPMASSIHFEYAVYMLPAPRKDPWVALRQALHHYPSLKLVAEVPKDPQEMTVSGRVQRNVHKDYPPPDLNLLQHFGLGISQGQAQGLQKSEEAFILEFAHP